jgi:hypothetical protein
MTSPNSKLLQRALAPMLKAEGFKKTSATWRRSTATTIAVVNLQGSQWGPRFYLNLGAYFRGLGENDKPCEVDCHIRTRLDDHVPDLEGLDRLLDFQFDADIDSRGREIERLLQEFGLPWLSHVSTVDGAKDWCERNPQSALVLDELREYLNLPVPPNNRMQRSGSP